MALTQMNWQRCGKCWLESFTMRKSKKSVKTLNLMRADSRVSVQDTIQVLEFVTLTLTRCLNSIQFTLNCQRDYLSYLQSIQMSRSTKMSTKNLTQRSTALTDSSNTTPKTARSRRKSMKNSKKT